MQIFLVHGPNSFGMNHGRPTYGNEFSFFLLCFCFFIRADPPPTLWVIISSLPRPYDKPSLRLEKEAFSFPQPQSFAPGIALSPPAARQRFRDHLPPGTVDLRAESFDRLLGRDDVSSPTPLFQPGPNASYVLVAKLFSLIDRTTSQNLLKLPFSSFRFF